MKQKNFWFITLLLAGAISTGRSQSVTPFILNAGGGSTTASGYIFEYNIGEMVAIATVSTPNLIVTQGLLQPVDNTLILPITLIHFQGVKMKDYNKLDWATGYESGYTQFELQRSEDGSNFTGIYNTVARGLANGSSYTYNDAKPFGKQVYYRLKIIEDGGITRYSSIVVLYGYEKNYWTVFPNPVTSGSSLQVNIQNSDAAKPVTLALFDAAGRKVLETKEFLTNGFQSIRLTVPVPPGLYSLKIENFLTNATQKILVK